MRRAGSATVEYLAGVAVVGVMFAGMVTLRPHHVAGKTPVDAIPPIVRLLGRPIENLAPRPARTPRPRPRPAQRPRPKPHTEEPATVLLPEWWRTR